METSLGISVTAPYPISDRNNARPEIGFTLGWGGFDLNLIGKKILGYTISDSSLAPDCVVDITPKANVFVDLIGLREVDRTPYNTANITAVDHENKTIEILVYRDTGG